MRLIVVGVAAPRVRVAVGVGVGCAGAIRRRRKKRGRRPGRPGAIPISKASGRAPIWWACRSSVRPSSPGGPRSRTRNSPSARRRPDSVPRRQRELRLARGARRRRHGPAVPLARMGQAFTSGVAGGCAGRRQTAADDAGRSAARGVDHQHLRHVQRLPRLHRHGAVRSLPHARRARVDVPGHLQQRQRDLPDARLRRDPLRDDPRDAHHSARRPAARVPGDSLLHGRSREVTGRATRSSSRRRTSMARPALRPTAIS